MFKTEASFVRTITNSVNLDINKINKINNKEALFIKKEVCLGYGIADIVVAKYQKNKATFRNNSLNLFDISLVRLIRNRKEIDIDEIRRITKFSNKKINISLQKLIEDKIIDVKKENFFSFNNYSSILTNSIAIEAKLKNWKRALNQAYRYKWFAEKSFVFLPKENISPAYKNIHLFKKMNVGLGTISESKELDILYTPKKEHPYSEDMWMLLNECILVNLSLISKKTPRKEDDTQN